MEKTMWLSKDKLCGSYAFWTKEPELSQSGMVWLRDEADRLFGMDPEDMNKLFPSLRLRPGQCIKVKVTNSPNGVSIRRV
jgi:hypothetical protein